MWGCRLKLTGSIRDFITEDEEEYLLRKVSAVTLSLVEESCQRQRALVLVTCGRERAYPPFSSQRRLAESNLIPSFLLPPACSVNAPER